MAQRIYYTTQSTVLTNATAVSDLVAVITPQAGDQRDRTMERLRVAETYLEQAMAELDNQKTVCLAINNRAGNQAAATKLLAAYDGAMQVSQAALAQAHNIV